MKLQIVGTFLVLCTISVAAQMPAPAPTKHCGVWCRIKRVFAQPSPECVRQYMCDQLGFCGPNASRIAIGSEFNCYTSDWTLGFKAQIKCPDPGFPFCSK
jgi:hypothetical protein